MLVASKKVKVPGPTLLYTLPFFSLELLRAIASGHVGIPPSRVRQTKGMKGRVGQPVQYRLCLTSHAEVEAFVCCAVRRPEHGVAFESPLRSVFAVVPPITFVLGGKLAPLYGDTAFNLRVVWGLGGITQGGEWMRTPGTSEDQWDSHRLEMVASMRFASKEYGKVYPKPVWDAADEFMIDPPTGLAEYWDQVPDDDDDDPAEVPLACRRPAHPHARALRS